MKRHVLARAGGRIAGQFVGVLVRLSGSTLPVSLTSYAVVGAAAYMGGATRMTLTTTVMVMETTGSLQLIVPIMITVFVAKVCSSLILPCPQTPVLHHKASQAATPVFPDPVMKLGRKEFNVATGPAACMSEQYGVPKSLPGALVTCRS